MLANLIGVPAACVYFILFYFLLNYKLVPILAARRLCFCFCIWPNTRGIYIFHSLLVTSSIPPLDLSTSPPRCGV
ncbi:hypothetical protein VNO78_03024 [Psophocarpus tetragonolobus]|uniref:Uncharacterized protein n=1 Tax=Psophocarpus tetragonolobus TaxID=3891 RepID=A0AAN9T0E2_PSOTE